MADLPFAPVDAGAASRLRLAVDPDDKILRAIEALGPVAGRDVVVLGSAPVLASALVGLGSRVTVVDPAIPGRRGNGAVRAEGTPPGRGQARLARPAKGGTEPGHTPGTELETDESPGAGAGALVAIAGTPAATGLAAGSADVVVATFQSVRGLDAPAVAEVDRILRPGGRFLVVADYGRDDLDPLRDPEQLAAAIAASRPSGSFLASGFRIRVIHTWWVFADCDAAGELLREAFGDAARDVVAAMKRPRLAHKVAIFHRTRGGDRPAAPARRIG